MARSPGVVAICAIAVFLLAGCTDEAVLSTGYTVQRSTLMLRIPATGELESKKSTPITAETNYFETQMLSRIAEENTFVREGEIVAIIDSRFFNSMLRQERLRVGQEDIKLTTKKRNLEFEQEELMVESGLLDAEHSLADQFSISDLTYVSRKEIIDNLRSQSYIQAKQLYNEWRSGKHQQKTKNELGMLDLQRRQIEIREQRYSKMIEGAEVRAPHDGLFVIADNLNSNQPYQAGDRLWPGSLLASIPDLSELQVRAFVLESESSGMKQGQAVKLRLHAYPDDEEIDGTLEQVSPVSKPLAEDNPQRFFEIVIRLDTPMRDHWRPGLQLDADIIALDLPEVLSIPSQALFQQDGGHRVLLRSGGQWQPQAVTIGARSLARTEITEGIDEGDVIALYRSDMEAQ